eukprot:g30090.t1
MRELKQTGWLAYKGRKTAGFYFVFILGLDWRVGAFHFEDEMMNRCGCVLGQDYPKPLGGPFRMREEEEEEEERRFHPNDNSGNRYTYKEFIDFAMSKGYDANFGKKCWEEARPVAALQEENEQLRQQLQAAEHQLRSLQGAA